MNCFDASTWIGRWPFAFVDAHTPRSLVAHLKSHGIRRALVSPLDAVFAPAPGPANDALLRATEATRELVPVPVINPALADWRDELAAVATDARVRAIRLLPSYHGYKLRGPAVNDFAEEAVRRRLRVVVQVRLIDERHEYHAMNIKPVRPADIGVWMRRHSKLRVLASGLLASEVLGLLPKNPRLMADLSYAEWHETIDHLLKKVPARQLCFATHTPFLVTAAARAKLDPSGLTKSKLAAIASGNLERWIG